MYKNPTPVAVTVARVANTDGSLGLLGIVRNIEPFIGGLAFPGGYVDERESIEVAAAREFLEETGLKTEPHQWRLISSAISPTSNVVLIFCELLDVLTAEQVAVMQPNSEVQGHVIMDASSKLAFPLHQQVAANYLGYKK